MIRTPFKIAVALCTFWFSLEAIGYLAEGFTHWWRYDHWPVKGWSRSRGGMIGTKIVETQSECIYCIQEVVKPVADSE